MGYRGTGKGYSYSSHGYKVIGHRQNREYEHRLIAAKALGRPLTRQEEVHHLSGKKDNAGGLVICSHAYHHYLHFLGRVRAKGTTRAQLIEWHHVDGLPLEEIKRRLGLGEGMIGRWFARMNIEIRTGVGGRGAIYYKARTRAALSVRYGLL